MDYLIFLIPLAILWIFSYPLLELIISLYKKRKRKRLKQQGRVIEATISAFKQEDVLSRNLVVNRIIAESKIGGKLYQFISEKIFPEKIDHLKVGDKIKVLVNMAQPKEYYFDPKKNEY